MTALARRPLWLGIGWSLVLLVVYLSLTPRPPPAGINIWDKASHAIAYFTLMFWFAQIHDRRLAVALWVLALGAGIEVAQGFTGYREASAPDMLANGVGVALAWLAAWRLPNPLARIETLWT
jgi:VanZ family protein